MFTWNLLYISKMRLEDTLNQLMVGGGDDKAVLIRIHTAIHTADEAVELAAFIKRVVPNAQIVGTSTSAIISGGKLIHDQCVISVTQLDEGDDLAARIPVEDEDGSGALSAQALCALAAERMVRSDTKLLFVFSPQQYRDIERLVEVSNECMPGVQQRCCGRSSMRSRTAKARA